MKTSCLTWHDDSRHGQEQCHMASSQSYAFHHQTTLVENAQTHPRRSETLANLGPTLLEKKRLDESAKNQLECEDALAKEALSS